MKRPHFISVKSNYKLNTKDFRASGGCNYSNTCAVRLSSALIAADPAFKKLFASSPGNICGPHGNKRGAQDLAAVLKTAFGGIDQSPNSASELNGKKGIICFLGITGFSGQGHITLWNQDYSVDGGEYWERCSLVWFWRLP